MIYLINKEKYRNVMKKLHLFPNLNELFYLIEICEVFKIYRPIEILKNNFF